MSGTFKGFTDRDILNMKTRQDGNKKVMKMPSNTQSRPVEQRDHLADKPTEAVTSEITSDLRDKPLPPETEPADLETNNNHDAESPTKSDHIDDVSYLNLEKPINVQEFQLHQKLIEEQNRKRKEMLSKALEDREKQTAEEVIRLENIKKELQSLDVQLSGDVSLLRKQIDKCSLSYMEAEKNYLKIETEFLAAKMLLQKEKERKEMLTEHLCTLIAYNEARKAKKLETLMDKLAYNSEPTHISDGVCEQTGKMLEIENGHVLTDHN